MIVGNFNVFRPSVRPCEDDPPLVVDADGVSSAKVAFERLQPVAWRYSEVVQSLSTIELHEFATGDLEEISRESLWGAALGENRL